MALTSKPVSPGVQTIPATVCTECQFRSSTPVASCPLCGGSTELQSIKALGTVWSHTLVHLPRGTHTHGYRLVYVDVDEGPRILCQKAAGDAPVSIGDRVQIVPGDDDIYEVKEVAA